MSTHAGLASHKHNANKSSNILHDDIVVANIGIMSGAAMRPVSPIADPATVRYTHRQPVDICF